MTLKEKQLEFIIYCIENTAERLGRYSADVYNKLKELGAIDGYINAFYDTLHTQGRAYIVDSLLEYIYHRDPQWLPEDYRPFQVSTQQQKGSGLDNSDKKATGGKYTMRWHTSYAQYLWNGDVMYGNPTERRYGPKADFLHIGTRS